MLIGLGIQDVVLIDRLDLTFGPGLTVLTGETGAGKSIILDALGMALGARADANLLRPGAVQASATAIFARGADGALSAFLEEKGLRVPVEEDLVLRRTMAADGRSRAFVNDQAVGVTLLRELGALLVEVHGQHETVGLLDARTHRGLLDQFGGHEGELLACARAWRAWRQARERLADLAAACTATNAEIEELSIQLGELDRLAPGQGEEPALAQRRVLLGAAERTLVEVGQARDQFAGEALSHQLGQAVRALERSYQRVLAAGADPEGSVARLIGEAASAVDRTLMEAGEAGAALDAAAAALTFDPDELERVEERLFAIRQLARRLGVSADDLPDVRMRTAARLLELEDAGASLAAVEAESRAAQEAYDLSVAQLSRSRRVAAERLTTAVMQELGPLKLDRARFRVGVEPLEDTKRGASGADQVEFEIATVQDAPFQGLGVIASGGELARFALALKAVLAARPAARQPLLIFDEVDQGVGGAVADAVGLRLKRLASLGQVFAVTHSPQVAARGDSQLQVRKAQEWGRERSSVVVTELAAEAREEEIARMLSGAKITDAARAAARALIDV